MTAPVSHRHLAAEGARSVAPMLIGMVPFGILAGTTPISAGMARWVPFGFSSIMFAGAAQLAAIDALASGHGAAVAIATALAINLRMVLYSASLAPLMAPLPLRRRLPAAYLLTDEAYAVTIVRPTTTDDVVENAERRWSYYMGAAFLLWSVWQLSTAAGVVLGQVVDKGTPIDFAIPLIFLVLLIPNLHTQPSWVAAAAGGLGAVLANQWGWSRLAILVGGAVGIVAGCIAEVLRPSDPGPDVMDGLP